MDRLLRTSQTITISENRPADNIALPEGSFVEITAAKQIGDYTIVVSFSDGVDRIIDFGDFLRSNHNPLIREYLDADKFAQFRVEDGDLIWGDFGMCFPIADLYENRI